VKSQNSSQSTATKIAIDSWKYLPETMAHILSRGKWKQFAHIVHASDIIVPALLKGDAKIIVTMPPRHGKSEFISHWLPVWFLSTFPDKKIILASYESSFAETWGEKVRDHIEENRKILGIDIKYDSRAAKDFRIKDKEGGMKTAGVGGPITGRGADLFIIDDPVKNWEDAMSERIREKHKRWWDAVADTRLEPGGSTIVLMTRWHEDDLGGYLINECGFTEIRLPALAEEGDPLGRKVGEALCPERYNAEKFKAIKAAKPRIFDSLYQQNPTAPEGEIFKFDKWRYYDEAPPLREFVLMIQSWDMAFKDLKSSDFVVGSVWGWRHRTVDFYLLDLVRRQMGLSETIREFLNLSGRWPKARKKLIEDAANGPAVEDALKKKVSGITLVPPRGSKLARALSIEPVQTSGHLWLPNPNTHPPDIAAMVKCYVAEMGAFNKGKYDDQVDSTSQAIDFLDRRANSSLYQLAQL